MTYTVHTAATVRSVRSQFKVCERSAKKGLDKSFGPRIANTLEAWGPAFLPEKRDALDEAIIQFLKAALEHQPLMVALEDDLRSGYNLEPEWNYDESRWDLYREAVATCLLQQHYDDHPELLNDDDPTD